MQMQPNAKRIKDLREQRAWPQAQLADVAGVSERTVQRIERGESVAFETLKSIATAFNVDVSELVQRKPRQKPVDFLVRVTNGTELFAVVAGSHAGRYHHEDLRHENEVETIGSFFQDIQDYCDIWDDIGPSGQLKAKHEFTTRLAELESLGYWVFVVKKTEHYKVNNEVVPMQVSTIAVIRKDNPSIVSAPAQPAVLPSVI